VDLVALLQELLRHVGAVLARHTGDEGALHLSQLFLQTSKSRQPTGLRGCPRVLDMG